MPVPSAMEHKIKIQRDSLTPQNSQISTPFGNNLAQQQQQQQQETRTFRQEVVTKRVIQGSTEPTVHSTTTKSQDLFSNKHNNDDRRGSNCSTTSSNVNNTTTSTNKNTQMKSSTLVSKALQEFEDDFQNQIQDVRRNSKTTTTTSTLLPTSTPTMEIVPSGSRSASPSWSMGTDAQGDVPLTYEIVTKTDGKREFQLLLTAREFSPEDLQVKLVDNTLTISGNHEETQPNGAYKQKSFSRTCTIPSGVRPEDLNCSLDSCGRLKITAPVPDLSPAISSHQKSIKTITSNQQNQNQNWTSSDNNGLLSKEKLLTVFDHEGVPLNEGLSQQQQQQHTTKTVTKTVKTFKSVA